MKKFLSLVILLSLTLSGFTQMISKDDMVKNNQKYLSISPVMINNNNTDYHFRNTRAEVSEWYDFPGALRDALGSGTNYYTLLFPDSLQQIYNDMGTIGTSRVRNHSVGSIFCPWSDIMGNAGYTSLNKMQPWKVDSVAVFYNYERFTGDNVADSLIFNFWTATKMLYYPLNGGMPNGGTVQFDSVKFRGKNYNKEIVVALTDADTISYRGRGMGMYAINLGGEAITPGNYFNPATLTWTFKPGFTYNINDTLIGDFELLPHSKLNNFYYSNFTDATKEDIPEYNQGLTIFSWTNAPKWIRNTGYGALYWPGTSPSTVNWYPRAIWKVTYDPDWTGLEPEDLKANAYIYPNPASEYLKVAVNKNGINNVSIEIVNSLGQVVLSTNRTLNTKDEVIELNVSGFVNGLYFCKISDGENNTTLNFIKQ
jgi:hypothetical protein